MIKRCILIYFFTISIPVFLGFAAWQSVRYSELEKNVRRLEAVQEDWVENNKRLIAGIAILTSSARIEQIAVYDLGFSKVRPENVLQVRIVGEAEN